MDQDAAHAGLAGCRATDRALPLCVRHLPKSGPVAQLGARLNGIQEVTGSIPVRSTTLRSRELTPKRELRVAGQPLMIQAEVAHRSRRSREGGRPAPNELRLGEHATAVAPKRAARRRTPPIPCPVVTSTCGLAQAAAAGHTAEIISIAAAKNTRSSCIRLRRDPASPTE